VRASDRLDRQQVAADRLPDDSLEQRHLVLEVEVDRRLAEPGARRDVVQSRAREALLDEQRQRGLDDLGRPLGRGPALLFHRLHITNLPVS